MFDTIAGLPVHPLVVHAAVVVVPAAALVLLLAAVSPRFRRWAFAVPLLLALGALVLVPVATESGDELKDRVGEFPAVETHAALGEQLLPWVIGLLVVAAALFGLEWQERRRRGAADGRGTTGSSTSDARSAPRALTLLLVVAAVVVSTGTTVQTIRIGHSGATAVWGPIGAITPSDSDAEDD